MVGAVGTAHSCSNPNTTVWNSRGIWLTYILMILFLHFTLLSIPGNDFKRQRLHSFSHLDEIFGIQRVHPKTMHRHIYLWFRPEAPL